MTDNIILTHHPHHYQVTDSKGIEVGQGVMCLRHAFPTSSNKLGGSVPQVLRRLVGGQVNGGVQ